MNNLDYLNFPSLDRANLPNILELDTFCILFFLRIVAIKCANSRQNTDLFPAMIQNYPQIESTLSLPLVRSTVSNLFKDVLINDVIVMEEFADYWRVINSLLNVNFRLNRSTFERVKAIDTDFTDENERKYRIMLAVACFVTSEILVLLFRKKALEVLQEGANLKNYYGYESLENLISICLLYAGLNPNNDEILESFKQFLEMIKFASPKRAGKTPTLRSLLASLNGIISEEGLRVVLCKYFQVEKPN